MTDRLITIKAFGNKRTQYNAATGSAIMKGKQMPITPFRAAMNAGDEAGSVNSGVLSHLYAPSQANGIGNMSKHFNPGGNSTGESAYTGNQKFVYDGSDYTRFKKLQAFNRERGAATAVFAAAASSGNTYDITVSFASEGNYGLTGNDRDGAVSGNDPAVNINVGDTITFTVNSGVEHPFYIKHTAATGPSITNQVSNPVATGTGAYGGQGAYDGSTISWTPNTAGTYFYQCGAHYLMKGNIIVT
tara:strand:- start:1023 stop:1757 length:735 start_codon:yes stop_codon:yes gene_type:complete